MKKKIYTAIYTFFLVMCIISLAAMLTVGLLTGKIWLILTVIIITATLTLIGKNKYLFNLGLVLLNFINWFVLGVMAFVHNNFSGLPGYAAYLLLVPYSLVSGGMVKILLEKTGGKKRSLTGAIIISSLFALVAATSAVIADLGSTWINNTLLFARELGMNIIINPSVLRPATGFFLVLLVFNAPFIIAHRKSARLWLYAIPVWLFLAANFILG